jgi:hypothetical protein
MGNDGQKENIPRRYPVKTMNKLLFSGKIFSVLLLLTLLTNIPAYAKTDDFTIQGNLQDYQWAYSSNRLAVLSKQEDSNQFFIHILDADKKAFIKKIKLPKSLDPNCLAWTRDETGFYLSTYNNSDDQGNIYVFDIKERTLKPVFESPETRPCGTIDIVLDPQSDFWAFYFTEEGHPGVSIYIGFQFLFCPCIGPENGIYTVAWKNGKLFCESDVMLDDELGCGDAACRMQAKDRNEGTHSPSSLYEIDPVKKIAKKSSLVPKDLTNTSYDGRYYITTETLENTFRIRLY